MIREAWVCQVYNHVSLFSGYAGIELGLTLAGKVCGFETRTILYVEREAFAVSNLVAKMEQGLLDKAPVWSDVTTLETKGLEGKVDIITGGFPCQPWSVAGQRKGIEDERWLWDDIYRLVCEIRPRFVFLENVPGLLAGGIGYVLGDLSKIGYDAEWQVFSAAECGASQRRERCFILGYSKDGRIWFSPRRFQYAFKSASKVLAQSGSQRPRWWNNGDSGGSVGTLQAQGSGGELDNSRCIGQEKRQVKTTGIDESNESMANTTIKGFQKSGSKELRELSAKDEGRIHDRFEQSECELGDTCKSGHERIKQHRTSESKFTEPESSRSISKPCYTFPPGPNETERWREVLKDHPEVEPAICGMADGSPDWLVRANTNRVDRLRSLGNGVVPIVGALAFITLAKRAGVLV